MASTKSPLARSRLFYYETAKERCSFPLNSDGHCVRWLEMHRILALGAILGQLLAQMIANEFYSNDAAYALWAASSSHYQKLFWKDHQLQKTHKFCAM